jgi:hypothetical protein
MAWNIRPGERHGLGPQRRGLGDDMLDEGLGDFFRQAFGHRQANIVDAANLE